MVRIWVLFLSTSLCIPKAFIEPEIPWKEVMSWPNVLRTGTGNSSDATASLQKRQANEMSSSQVNGLLAEALLFIHWTPNLMSIPLWLEGKNAVMNYSGYEDSSMATTRAGAPAVSCNGSGKATMNH